MQISYCLGLEITQATIHHRDWDHRLRTIHYHWASLTDSNTNVNSWYLGMSNHNFKFIFYVYYAKRWTCNSGEQILPTTNCINTPMYKMWCVFNCFKFVLVFWWMSSYKGIEKTDSLSIQTPQIHHGPLPQTNQY